MKSLRKLKPSTLSTSERSVEQYLKKRIENKFHGRVFKFISPGMRGVPDRIVLLPGGYLQFIELKGLGKKVSKVQKNVHTLFASLGHNVLVLDSKFEVDGYIRFLTNELKKENK